MPDVSLDPAFDDPARWDHYWPRRPADHNPAGLFVDGPQPAVAPMNKQARRGRYHAVGKFTDNAVPEPREKRAADLERRCAAGRARRLLTAVRRAA
jgi:hypothetical protein